MCRGACFVVLQDAEVCDSLDLLSTTQAEYEAMSDMGKEILFSRQVWCFMLPTARMPCIAMYEDNEGAIQNRKAPDFQLEL